MVPQNTLTDFGMVAKGPNAIVFKGDGSVDDLQAKWAGTLSLVS
jgi:hypothetical protein